MNEDEDLQRILEELEQDPVARLYSELGEGVFDAPDLRKALAHATKTSGHFSPS
jgi:hypothetical protein